MPKNKENSSLCFSTSKSR